jgi:acylphosphatase
MSKEMVRYKIQFWAAGVFRSRHLHFGVRDKAEELELVGTMTWDLMCQHEAVLEGTKEQLEHLRTYLEKAVRRHAEDMDDFRVEKHEATGEFDSFTTVFEAPEEEAAVVVPDYIDELNENESETQ